MLLVTKATKVKNDKKPAKLLTPDSAIEKLNLYLEDILPSF